MQPKPALTLAKLLLLLAFSGFAWQVSAQEPHDPARFQQQGDRFFQERKLEKAAEAYQRPSSFSPIMPNPTPGWVLLTAPWAGIRRPSRPFSRPSGSSRTPPLPTAVWGRHILCSALSGV